jgi:dCMP deaminase
VSRPSWDDYFLKMAMLVAERSTCLRHHMGAVLVRDRRVLATGYNGAAKGLPARRTGNRVRHTA